MLWLKMLGVMGSIALAANPLHRKILDRTGSCANLLAGLAIHLGQDPEDLKQKVETLGFVQLSGTATLPKEASAYLYLRKVLSRTLTRSVDIDLRADTPLEVFLESLGVQLDTPLVKDSFSFFKFRPVLLVLHLEPGEALSPTLEEWVRGLTRETRSRAIIVSN